MNLAIGDQVRLRRRGGAVARVYRISDIVSAVGKSPRLFELESEGMTARTAYENDLVIVVPPLQEQAGQSQSSSQCNC